MSFTFFREAETGFDDPVELRKLKDAASAALCSEEYGSLTDRISPLFQDHEIERFDNVSGMEPGNADGPAEGSPGWLAGNRGVATLPAILTGATGKWFKGLIGYLTTYKMFFNRDAVERPGALDEFFPLMAVLERTRNIDGSSPLYLKDELDQLNDSFLKKVGNPPTMNPIHIEGPSHYGHYYPLIDYWMETEWHEVRHRLYGAKSCILSSDWHLRDVFDFDATSKATYVSDVRIDDSLRVTQEGFGEIVWDVLFATVTDRKWRDLLGQLRTESDSQRRRAHAEAILDLLASKLSAFHFENENGVVSISMKRTANLGYLASYTGIVTKHHNTLEGLLGSPLAAMVEVAALSIGMAATNSRVVTQGIRPLVKGAKYVFQYYKQRELRRAVVPDIYYGM
jgi:hypothetical protein